LESIRELWGLTAWTRGKEGHTATNLGVLHELADWISHRVMLYAGTVCTILQAHQHEG